MDKAFALIFSRIRGQIAGPRKADEPKDRGAGEIGIEGPGNARYPIPPYPPVPNAGLKSNLVYNP